jgi:biotin operon repressor
MKGNNNMKAIKEMNKTELVSEVQRLNEINDTNEGIILDLIQKLESSSKDGRKSQVLELLRKHSSISILELAEQLSISTKNVSSQLTYLRSDGYQIFTDPKGRKCLFEAKKDESDSSTEDDSTDEDLPMNEDSKLLGEDSMIEEYITDDESILNELDSKNEETPVK